MLIILEGVDGAGKTTLANELLGYLAVAHAGEPVRLLHKGPPIEHPLIEYEDPLVDYQPGQGEHVICDRWHLGEVVYPPVLGRSSQLTPNMLLHIEAFLQDRGAIIVHVDQLTSVIQERIGVRGDDLVKLDMIHALRLGYLNALDDTSLRVVLPSSLEHVVRVAEEQERLCLSDITKWK